MTRPVLATLVAVPLLLSLLAGCGSGDDYSAYCDAVSAHQSDLTKDFARGEAGLLAAIPAFEDLRDQAPSDIRRDWGTLITALTDLRKALDDAGVKSSDYTAGKAPTGVTAAERKAIVAAADKVSSTKVQEASQHVQQQARDVCHTPLTL